MQNDDVIRLQHMLDAAKEAVSFVKGKERKDLDTDRKLVLALLKCVEIIGEAASRISASSKKECLEIPWDDIVGMRNRLIHAYYDVNLDVIWHTVIDELPPLVKTLNKIVSQQNS